MCTRTISRRQKYGLPIPVFKISLVPSINCDKNFNRAVSSENKDRLVEARRNKHSNAYILSKNYIKKSQYTGVSLHTDDKAEYHI